MHVNAGRQKKRVSIYKNNAHTSSHEIPSQSNIDSQTRTNKRRLRRDWTLPEPFGVSSSDKQPIHTHIETENNSTLSELQNSFDEKVYNQTDSLNTLLKEARNLRISHHLHSLSAEELSSQQQTPLNIQPVTGKDRYESQTMSDNSSIPADYSSAISTHSTQNITSNTPYSFSTEMHSYAEKVPFSPFIDPSQSSKRSQSRTRLHQPLLSTEDVIGSKEIRNNENNMLLQNESSADDPSSSLTIEAVEQFILPFDSFFQFLFYSIRFFLFLLSH